MFCNYCGADNPADAAFCRACGRAHVSAAPAPGESPAFEHPEIPVAAEADATVAPGVAAPPDNPKSFPRWSVALAALVVVAIAAVVLINVADRREAADAQRQQEDRARLAELDKNYSAANEPDKRSNDERLKQLLGTIGITATAQAPTKQQQDDARARVSMYFPPDQNDPDAVQCDRLADHPLDPDRIGDGVNVLRIDVDQARPVCERAVLRTPARPRYLYLYGRVLDADGRPADAARYYAAAESGGYAMAALNLGWAYAQGRGVPQNREWAIEFFNRAMWAGAPNTRAAIATVYMDATPPDYVNAKWWYENAVEHEEPLGYSGLARMYDLALGVAADRTKGAELARKAADLGDVDGMFWTGRHFKDGQGVAADPAAACWWFDKAAREGYAYAQLEDGRCFYTGAGGSRNHESAFYWLIRAARAGLPQAQELVGDMYAGGEGVAADQAQAVAWYRKAAEQDDAYGMMQLGSHLRDGRGAAWSEAEAMQWFEKAAQKGYAPAQSSLGQGYLIGLGRDAGQGRQDYQQAAYWFDLAAKQGEGFALINLGVMYENGWGLPQDIDRARQLYTQAARNEHPEVAKVGAQYLATASAASSPAPSSAGIAQRSPWDGWKIVLGIGFGLAAASALFGGSPAETGHRASAPPDAGGSDYVPSGGYTPEVNWSSGGSSVIAPMAPTRPDLYYPSNPTRSVNGDLTDPSIARR